MQGFKTITTVESCVTVAVMMSHMRNVLVKTDFTVT